VSDVSVQCRDLVVRYDDLTAVDHLTLEARRGQVLALLGPNGAGKTSTIETLEGYRRPSEGTAVVLGLDPYTRHAAVVPRIGVMLQQGGIYPVLSPRRALRLFASYYESPEDPDTLLELVGLGAVASTPWRRLSGGERQRLSLALALVGRPDVAFLDEPTAGVDPEGRIAIRSVIMDLRDRGVCVLLTTHELAEAERLADEVVIIAGGTAIARGSVAQLISGEGGVASGAAAGIRFRSSPGLDLAALAGALVVPGEVTSELAPGDYRIDADATPARVAALATWLDDHGLAMSDLRAGSRTLEDAYLDAVRRATGV
jgi:ABC-2 type transport system ATP-binding protein